MLDGDVDGTRLRSWRCAARGLSCLGRLCLLAEHRDVAQGMEVLPGNALRVGHPVLFATGVAAADAALVEQRHVGGVSARLQLGEFLLGVSLEAEVVNAGLAARVEMAKLIRGSSSIHLA